MGAISSPLILGFGALDMVAPVRAICLIQYGQIEVHNQINFRVSTGPDPV